MQDAGPVGSAAVQCLFIAAVLHERSTAASELQTWQEAQHPWQPVLQNSGVLAGQAIRLESSACNPQQ